MTYASESNKKKRAVKDTNTYIDVETLMWYKYVISAKEIGKVTYWNPIYITGPGW